MRFVMIWLVGILAWASAGLAEERVALVVGNRDYVAVSALDNAGNDARLISAALEQVGFQVTLLLDATQADLRRAIAQFGRTLRASGPETVGLFYYAGHGVQSFGSNYLLPVDAQLTDAADLDLVALEAASVLRQMASARNRTNIVILDACRNNPFEDIRDLNDNGLAEMNAPTGTFLSYATAPGAVALDGIGDNSPFSAALARSIQTEGQPIEQVFKAVRVKVIEETKGAQTPWDTSSLTQNFMFRPGRQLSAEEVAEQQLWESVRASRDPVQIMLFLRSHPEGMFEAEARGLLGEVLSKELAVATPQTPAVQTPQTPSAETLAPQGGPDSSEVDLLEAARASGRIEDYRAYLEAFPTGVFAELVKIEIAGIASQQSKDPDAGQQVAVATPEPAPVVPEPQEAAPVFFDQPMQQGVPEIMGRTILEAANGSPLFAPFAGLPEELWKGQKCSNCHQWTREALCDQAKTYLKQSAERSLAKNHPYGGSYKRNLRAWAGTGCQ